MDRSFDAIVKRNDAVGARSGQTTLRFGIAIGMRRKRLKSSGSSIFWP
jgi:hypothetical protein